jgi:acetyl-CoA/propionyl-CoA carboxylase biotin carboxyl carrier protein
MVESEELLKKARSFSHRKTNIATSPDGRTRERALTIEVDGRRFDVRVHVPEPPWAGLARRRHGRRAGLHGAGTGAVVSPMQGTVLKVEVADGEAVLAGQVLCVVEAMKMENEIAAPRDGTVRELGVEAGHAVTNGQIICLLVDE